MAKIPPRQDILVEALENGQVELEYRGYIGMSSLLGNCTRKMWYDFHWAYPRFVTRRTNRIFDRGHLEEARVVADLREAGMIVTGCLENQAEFVDSTGHIKGHSDGRVDNVPSAPKTPHLLEVKTMKDSQYKSYLKKGLAVSHPYYWSQIHTYMGEAKLTRCLFVVTNKDTEERSYIRYDYEPEIHKEALNVGFQVLTAEIPPKKIGEATWFACKMCNAREICHKGADIKVTCRSCKFVDIEMEGKWSCNKHNRELSTIEQMDACSDYSLSEVFE